MKISLFKLSVSTSYFGKLYFPRSLPFHLGFPIYLQNCRKYSLIFCSNVNFSLLFLFCVFLLASPYFLASFIFSNNQNTTHLLFFPVFLTCVIVFVTYFPFLLFTFFFWFLSILNSSFIFINGTVFLNYISPTVLIRLCYQSFSRSSEIWVYIPLSQE